MTTPAHGSLFVVACPACGGWNAVGAGMAGAAACCPLCAAAFMVPTPTDASTPPAPIQHEPTPVRPAPAAPAPAAAAPQAVQPPETIAEISPQPVATAAEQPPAFEVPDHVLVPAEPARELQFREPATRTIGSGANAIELRRLTPEERDARRRRRNLIILLSGAAILIAIAVVMGFGRPRRRSRSG